MQAHELMAPGFCILCEGSTSDIEFYDTNYNLVLDTTTYLSGRKYVCEICFTAMAEHWGYEASNQVEAAEAAVLRVKGELKDLYTTLDEQKNLVMETWREVENTPVKVRGRPRKKVVVDEGE